MPKIIRPKTAAEIKRLKKPGLYAVGEVSGLQMQVSPSGARSWVLRAQVGLKRRDIGLGGYPDVTLAMAREAARAIKGKIKGGIDPVEERRTNRQALIAEQARQITFREAAGRFIAYKSLEFKNSKHVAQWTSTLEKYAYPVIGNLPVDKVDLNYIQKILEPIWLEKTETANRVRGRIESVLSWATVAGFRSGENPARWKNHLDKVLPAPSKIRKVQHFEALPWQAIGQFMAELRNREGMAARALEFLILTAARSGEVRGMTWDEIDLDSKIWTVPADRIKAGKRHKIPLSEPAITLLSTLPRFNDVDLVFPSPRGKQLSDVSLIQVIRRMGNDVTPHGFRSTFKDWCRSCTAYPDEVSELALAHVNSDATRAAYARDELLPKRTRLMRDWAKFCETVQDRGKVLPIRSDGLRVSG